MTQRKITAASERISICKKDGFYLEAFFANYHLNVGLLKFILLNYQPNYLFDDKKFKQVVKDIESEIKTNSEMKAVLNKKSFNLVKNWLAKTDIFFKELRFDNPRNTKQLLDEAETIAGILTISANKIFVRVRA